MFEKHLNPRHCWSVDEIILIVLTLNHEILNSVWNCLFGVHLLDP